MNRTDRLYALREELRRAGTRGRTAEQLARSFEVSTRTVKRDVSALQQAGFPVWARPGRMGGYVVDREATLPPVNLSASELSGLAAAVAAHRGQPFEHHARTALIKLLSVMVPSERHRATALADRVWLDRPSGLARDGSTGRAIEQALVERRVVALTSHESDDPAAVHAHPQLLAHTEGHWFLAATVEPQGEVRWFRLDLVTSATLTRQQALDLPVGEVGTPPSSARPVIDNLTAG
ncbi:helix-turn-helix transcriptional regulator [Nocardioides sp.]|uniref:helix-turn-helix transcriptional regulator n=1 Tax=Nocardioides sp. TaxID=35761 RepID=UPI002D102006|nr:HTH domain-containing protein [Nocardioides sp.]HXH80940.1 HTH domain-containing protein [Nocardioides sp.]